MLRLQHDLYATIRLIPKSLIHVRSLFQRRVMGDYEGWIDLAGFDPLQEFRQIILHRRLRHPEGQATIDGRAHWDFVEKAAIDTNDRNCAEIAAAMNGLPQNMGAVGPHESCDFDP